MVQYHANGAALPYLLKYAHEMENLNDTTSDRKVYDELFAKIEEDFFETWGYVPFDVIKNEPNAQALLDGENYAVFGGYILIFEFTPEKTLTADNLGLYPYFDYVK